MTTITTAFQDAVHDSQHCFRRLLKAMSEPGHMVTLQRSEGFGSLHKATTQILLSMSDNATPIWLSHTHQHDEVISDNIRFHCGSAIAANQNDASFAVIAKQDLATFDWDAAAFNLGTDEYPDQSATVIVELSELNDGELSVSKARGGELGNEGLRDVVSSQKSNDTVTLTLSGPGIETQSTLTLGQLPVGFQAFLQTRQEQVAFPKGLDLILVSDDKIACLPRTTHIEVNSCTSQ
ncbi:phosphonate C-P lyase system protein PhnH [Vibrio mytili]|uniref:Phosphonate metabolism protein PhnH n=1 Tax=Vibrio mytili TaxID=50718 RepID=A0A0C3I963_9VIBR|nr:phosphonate C-P lyase system protein PhnH [Vibrio mytili]KIN10862.1 phosphonate metabolism protein PhnH [Vibrio mytili]